MQLSLRLYRYLCSYVCAADKMHWIPMKTSQVLFKTAFETSLEWQAWAFDNGRLKIKNEKCGECPRAFIGEARRIGFAEL